MESVESSQDGAPEQRPKEAAIERWLDGEFGDIPAGSLSPRYATLSPEEKAETLYNWLLTLKSETDAATAKDLRAQAKALAVDPETRRVFLRRFADARVERVDLRRSPAFRDVVRLETEITALTKEHHALERQLFTGTIVSPAGQTLARERLADLAGQLVAKQSTQEALIRLEEVDHTPERTNVAAQASYERLQRYRAEALEGFAWLPSRQRIHREIVAALANGRFPLLVGEPGTGKSEQADAVAKEFTGLPSVKVPCTSSSGEHDLLFQKDVEGGTSYLNYGGVTRAFTGYENSLDSEPRYQHGRVVRLDEFLKLNFDKSFGLLKDIAQKRPGQPMHEQVPHPVLSGATIIATTNPAGTRHNLQPLVPALKREFAPIEVDYLPMTAQDPELYEFLVATLMNEHGVIPVSRSELAPAYEEKPVVGRAIADGRTITAVDELIQSPHDARHGVLYRLAFAVRAIQDAYTAGNPTQRARLEPTLLRYSAKQHTVDAAGEPLVLEDATLTLREVASWMRGYHNRLEWADRAMHQVSLAGWLAYKASTFVAQTEEADREKLRAIFAHFGIFDSSAPEQRDQPMTPQDIGYLSPRVPRPVHLAPAETEPKEPPTAPETLTRPTPELHRTKTLVLEDETEVVVVPDAVTVTQGEATHHLFVGGAFHLRGERVVFAGVVDSSEPDVSRHGQWVIEVENGLHRLIDPVEVTEHGENFWPFTEQELSPERIAEQLRRQQVAYVAVGWLAEREIETAAGNQETQAGYEDASGVWHAYPTPETIGAYLAEDPDFVKLLQTKAPQDFLEVRVTPFLPLNEMVGAIDRQVISLGGQAHFDNWGDLEKFKMLTHLDTGGKLAGGVTYAEMVAQADHCTFLLDGYLIEVTVAGDEVPRKSDVVTVVGGRLPIQGGQTAIQYRQLLKEEPYRGEATVLPHSYLGMFAQKLYENYLKFPGKQLEDDGTSRILDSLTYTWFVDCLTASGDVPNADWSPGDRRFHLGAHAAGGSNAALAPRPAVRRSVRPVNP